MPTEQTAESQIISLFQILDQKPARKFGLGQRFAMPLAYDKAADDDSWAQTQFFFKEIFAQ